MDRGRAGSKDNLPQMGTLGCGHLSCGLGWSKVGAKLWNINNLSFLLLSLQVPHIAQIITFSKYLFSPIHSLIHWGFRYVRIRAFKPANVGLQNWLDVGGASHKDGGVLGLSWKATTFSMFMRRKKVIKQARFAPGRSSGLEEVQMASLCPLWTLVFNAICQFWGFTSKS